MDWVDATSVSDHATETKHDAGRYDITGEADGNTAAPTSFPTTKAPVSSCAAPRLFRVTSGVTVQRSTARLGTGVVGLGAV
jgi:hypothetical protein